MPFQGINITNSDYIPQYAGLPLDAMEKVGDELATRHYENIARGNQMELLAMQQLANTPSEADKGVIQEQLGGIRSAISEMAKNGGENASSKISALATRFLGDEGLIRIKRNADQYRAQQELKAKFGERGVFNERATQDYLARGSRDEQGNWRDFMNTAQERLDYTKKADQIFAPLEANTYQTDLEADAKTTLKAFGIDKVIPGVSGDIASLPAKFKTTIIEKLSKERIEDFAFNQGGWEDYKQSSEYAQQKNILNLDDEQIKDEFISRGYAKIYNKIRKDWENNPALGGLGRGAGEESVDPYSSTVTMPNQPNIKVDPGFNVDDFDPITRERRKNNVKSSFDPMTGVEIDAPVTEEYRGAKQGISGEKWKKFNETAKVAAEVFGVAGFNDVDEKSSPEELAKAQQYTKQYLDFVNNRVHFPKKLTGTWERLDQKGRDRAENATTDLRRHITSAFIYDPVEGKMVPIGDKSGKGFSKKAKELLGENNIKNLEITAELDPKNYFTKQANNPALADSYAVQINDPDDPDKFTEVFISNPVKKDTPERAYKLNVNKVYTEFNLEPGKEKTVDIYGMKIKGKELMGKQIDTYLESLSEADREKFLRKAADPEAEFMPIQATIPGVGTYVFNGADHLTQYIKDLRTTK